MTRILALSGSLRRASANTALLQALKRVAPPGIDVLIYERLDQLPFFNPDVTPSPAVVEFQGTVGGADAMVISSPEYAHGVPGVLKNALDWLVGGGELIDKPVAVLNASGRATHARTSLVDTLTVMSARVIEDASITVPLEGSRLNAEFIAADPQRSVMLREALAALIQPRRPSSNAVTDYLIVPARVEDLPRVPIIELAAAQLLRGHAPDGVLQETSSEDELIDALREGRLWVALANDLVVGYAHVQRLDSATAHLEEVDVLPEHGRRGIGTSLVTRVCDWARVNRYERLTLTTFRDVPWNMPFYQRLGFGVIPQDLMGPQLLRRVEDEERRGLDPRRRVAMSLDLRPNR